MAQEITVPAGHEGQGLASYLGRTFPVGYVRKLFRKNGVRLNGRRAKKLDLLHSGDRIELFIPFEPASIAAKNRQRLRAEIEVLFEGHDLLVINKPAGVAVQEGKNIAKDRTLLGILEARFREAPFQPALVHRLDKDTSGVLLVAKNQQAARELERCFAAAAVNKEYLCLVAGRLSQNGAVDLHLPGRAGKPVRAVTRYKVAKFFFDATLVHANIETGRMHQIRLHFAKLGYPVVMDQQHGDFGFNKSFRRRTGLKRQFLHAARMALTFRGKYLSWQAPLPDDLRQTLQILESENRRSSKRSPPLSSAATPGRMKQGD